MAMDEKYIKEHLDHIETNAKVMDEQTKGIAMRSVISSKLVILNEYAKQQKELKELRAFKANILELQGQGLDVANWHLNGEVEPLDNFIESALEAET